MFKLNVNIVWTGKYVICMKALLTGCYVEMGKTQLESWIISSVLNNYSQFILTKTKHVVWLLMRQPSTRDQNDTEINNYKSQYGLQQ